MTIEVNFAQVLAALPALERIGACKLAPAAAIRVARLAVRLGLERAAFERARFELIQRYGGTVNGQRATLAPPEKAEGETDAAFSARVAQFNESMAHLQAEAENMQAETVSVDADKLPLALLERVDALAPNDLRDIWPFVSEEERP